MSDRLVAAVEALLFVADGPVRLGTLARVLEVSEAEARRAVEALSRACARPDRGVEVVEVAGGFALATKPELAPLLEAAGRARPAVALSRAALETLAVIAYRQPITRPEIDAIRGVNSDSAVRTLLDRGLVRELGRKNAVGRPILYGTTEVFLQAFGLKSLDDLPEAEGVPPLEGLEPAAAPNSDNNADAGPFR